MNKWVSLLFAFLLCACAAEKVYVVEAGETTISLNEHQQSIIDLFEDLPDWTSEEYTKDDMQTLSQICDALSVYSNKEIESALVALSDHQNFPYPSIANASRGFIVMRAIFELPETVSTQGLRYYSSFNSLQNTDSTFYLSWPLKFDGDGKLIEVQSFTGCHGSCAYHFLREFRSFSALYNRRAALSVLE